MKVHRRFLLSIIGLLTALLLCGGAWAGEKLVAGAENTGPRAADVVRLMAARASVSPEATTLTLELSGQFDYRPAPSGDRLLFVDLPGVLSTEDTESRLLPSTLVSSYRLVPYVREDQQGARLEVLLKTAASVSYETGADWLRVKFTPAGSQSRSPSEVPSPAASAAEAPAAAGPVAEGVAPGPPVAKPSEPRAPAKAVSRGDVIQKVVVSPDPAGPKVRVIANGPVDYKSFFLDNPIRLVLDIPNTQSRPSKEIPVHAAPVKAVRIGQFSRRPPVSRVVLDLERNVPYNVNRRDDGLEVELKAGQPGNRPLPDARSQPAIASQAEAQEASASPPAPQVAALEEKNQEGQLVLTASLRPEAITLPVPKTETPETKREAQPAPTPPAPASAPTPPADHPPLAPLNVANASAPPPVSPAQPASQQVTPVPATAPAPQAPAAKRYTGEMYSFDLKDVDLKDFFRTIHEISGLNIVLDPAVGGRVTLDLADVPWDQALDIVLRNNGLEKQLEGNVLRIALAATVQQEEANKAAIEAARQAATELVTVVRPLNYAKATEVLPILLKFAAARSSLVADSRTNTLIITAIPQAIPTIDDILKTLDRKTFQVEIEARVVAASRSFSREIGAQFGFATTSGGGRTVFTGNSVGANNSPWALSGFPQPVEFPNNLPLFSNFPAAGASTGLTILHRSPNAAIDMMISLAETKGEGKLLSRPRIITQNNIQGSVQQGVMIPVQTTVNNTISVQFTPVTLKLQVTPQVTNDGMIFLQITVTNSSIDPGIARINGVPAVDTQEATTQVLVADGGTVVFGGVLQNNNNLTIQQVPILGSIPILGNLFKRTGVSTNTNELLFFITPRII
jgi:type IV pilus assembly protein PilQ